MTFVQLVAVEVVVMHAPAELIRKCRLVGEEEGVGGQEFASKMMCEYFRRMSS